MAEVEETIATQIATRTDAIPGSIISSEGRLLGFKPQVPCLASYVRVGILLKLLEFQFSHLQNGVNFAPTL